MLYTSTAIVSLAPKQGLYDSYGNILTEICMKHSIHIRYDFVTFFLKVKIAEDFTR